MEKQIILACRLRMGAGFFKKELSSIRNMSNLLLQDRNDPLDIFNISVDRAIFAKF